MRFVLTHIPHLLPALVGLGLLARFGVHATRLPPAHLSDEQLAAWHLQQAARRRPPRPVSRTVSRLATLALPLLVAGIVTGFVLYGVALGDGRPGGTLIRAHTILSTVGLLLVTAKVARLGRRRLAQGLDGRRFLQEGTSLLLVGSSVPLALTGVLLLARPASDSFTAYVHLIAGVWWTIVLQWHLFRYLGRALRAALGGGTAAAGARPAGEAR